MTVLFNKIVLLFLQRFFIGYWILKTGLDFYPGPFLFEAQAISQRVKAQCVQLEYGEKREIVQRVRAAWRLCLGCLIMNMRSVILFLMKVFPN